MKNILCYGDSNTWGYIPGSAMERYPRDVRWTGVLQKLLGEEYDVIEEGLNGRTTCFEDPTWPGRNGISTFYVTMESSLPVDLVIIMLGTNDAKSFFPGKPFACGYSMELYSNVLKGHGYGPNKTDPKVLLVSPIAIKEGLVSNSFDAVDSPRFAAQLSGIYKAYANQCGFYFFDAATVAEPAEADGIHMSPESHKALACALKDEILKIIG